MINARRRKVALRICIIFDCLYPWTIGGAERWYRGLATELAAQGFQVTYITLQQWDSKTPPDITGVDVIAVGPPMPLYRNGRRRVIPPLRFGFGVFMHLLRHGRRYDMIHTALFPYFSFLAAALLRPVMRYGLTCDWFEVWDWNYWRDYLGSLGFIGWLVQRLCARLQQRAYVFSHLHGNRARHLGIKGPILQIAVGYDGKIGDNIYVDSRQPPTVFFAGRFIPEKRIGLLIEALALARHTITGLTAELFGNGPERAEMLSKVKLLGLADTIKFPGFVAETTLMQAMSEAMCLVQPSSREGYGLVVIEAAARGVPAILVAGKDNAAPELILPNQNGYVVPDANAQMLANAIIACWQAGETIRASTRLWYAENAERLSLSRAVATIAENYRADIAPGVRS
jgi:glycosyltransferase involved in cell wall biosynthesis